MISGMFHFDPCIVHQGGHAGNVFSTITLTLDEK
jgi:hypothetical protein